MNNNIIVSIPTDLKQIKSILIFGLTKRQFFGFLLTALIAFPTFYLIKIFSIDLASLGLVLVSIPFVFSIFYTDEKLYADKHLKNLIEEKVIYKERRLYQITDKNYEVSVARGFIKDDRKKKPISKNKTSSGLQEK